MLGLSSCNNNDEEPKLEAGFTVTVENVAEAKKSIWSTILYALSKVSGPRSPVPASCCD